MVTGAPVILFALDPNGTITLSEGAALASLGLEPGATVGHSVFDLYQDQPTALGHITRALSGEAVAATLTLDGVTFNVQYSPQVDEQGVVEQVIGVATDITPQERAESELQRWVAFDRLVHRIFTQFIEIAPDASVTPEQFDAAILKALGEIGRFAGAARAFILEKTDEGDILNQTYEWRADGIGPVRDGVRAIPVESVPWMMEQVDKGKMLYIPAVEALPPGVIAQIVGFGCEGLRGMVCMPMSSRGRVAGVIGLEWTDSPNDTEIQSEIRQMVVVQGLFSNALQQRRIGGDLQRKNRLLRAVLECSDALIRARDEDVLLQEICRIVVEVGGFVQAWVGFDQGDEGRSILPVAQYGYAEDYLHNLKITWDEGNRGRGPMGRAIRTRAPAAVENIATDLDFAPWRDEAMQRGCRSAVAIPLVYGDDLLGGIIVYAGVPWAFDALEVEILQRFAGYLAYGIVALRTQALRKTAESQLRDSLRSKEQLIASISHEMRTPLTAVVGFAQLLQIQDSGLSSEERAELIR
ncbi:MAG TPA: GAF domain-containing protein, partial [Acidimicrobiia bacterium]|nr:GAF domain-containing protein [Acidimicrobiia bacterium]